MGDQLNTVSLEHPSNEENIESRPRGAGRENGHVPPIFVVGVWRSGTTLLYSLLNAHPDIRLFYESDLPVLWPMFRLPWERKSWVDKWEYWNAGVSRHDFDPAQLEGPVTSLADAFTRAGREYAAQTGKTRWGCKSPSYYDRMDYLYSEFPDAKFVVIWRDPQEIVRSVIAAKATALWFTRPGMTLKALLASRTLKKQVDKLQKTGAAVHQIHYRDLVEDPKTTMRGICDFVEVPFNPAVTDLSRGDRGGVFEGAHHTLAKGGQIVAKKDRKDQTPPEMAEKIRRYKAMWKADAGDGWMLSSRFAEENASMPTLRERMRDRFLFMLLRTWDIAPRLVFSVLPLKAWQTYRRLKYKDASWVHQQITNKPTTLGGGSSATAEKAPVQASTSQAATPQVSGDACKVRLGKIPLQSMEMEALLTNGGNELKHVVTVNSEIFVYAHEQPAFEQVLQRTVNTVDGRIVQLFCSLIYPAQGMKKLAGSDFIYNLADHAAKRGERIFLLGADPEANRGTAQILKTRYPGLQVEGYSPAFSANIQDQSWNEDILSRIAACRPTHLVVCFGPVKQEMWIQQNANYLFGLGVRCAYGLGGTLDFVSGRKKRAPRWMQIAGVEWLYRAIVEPARIGRTAKMFKMPYFALRFYRREIECR
jgi:N-acetylglucosaminyldiphosphoundecaprenol N-acetyl-beta-D-mannosaminyltransferase